MLWKFHQVYNPGRQNQARQRPVSYQIELPQAKQKAKIDPASLYVYPATLGSPFPSSSAGTPQIPTD